MEFRVLANGKVEHEAVVVGAPGHQVIAGARVDDVPCGQASDQSVVVGRPADVEFGQARVAGQRDAVGAGDGQRAAEVIEAAELDCSGEVVADQLDRAAAGSQRAGVQRGIGGDVSGDTSATSVDLGSVAGDIDRPGNCGQTSERNRVQRRVVGNIHASSCCQTSQRDCGQQGVTG